MKKIIKYFNKTEWIIYLGSIALITILFLIFKNRNFLYLIGAVIGVSSLIFDAKGNVFGQFLGLIFDILYAIQNIRTNVRNYKGNK